MNLVRELIKKGVSKYKIAKYLGVHWNTVRRWELQEYIPNEEHGIKLMELLNGDKDETL